MATLTAAGNQAEIWSKAFFRYGLQKMFWSRFIGNPMRLNSVEKKPRTKMILTDANAMIQLKMDLTKQKGDDITFPLIAPLTGHGRVGTTSTLEGNEEGISNYEWKATIKQWGHAVLDSGPLMRQQAAFDWDPVSRDTLALWYAWALDAATYCALAGLSFNDDGAVALVAAAAPSRQLFCGSPAGVFTTYATNTLLAATAYFSLECISLARRTAVASEPIMRPIIIDGQPRYLMFLHPLQVKALKATSDYKTLMQSSIAERGTSKNPIFNGSIGTYDGVILYEYQRTQTRVGDGGAEDLTTTGNTFDTGDGVQSGTTSARAIFAGAQAAVHAYAAKPKFIQKSFDYGRNHGNAVDMLIGVGRPEFNSVDYGVMTVDTAVLAD